MYEIGTASGHLDLIDKLNTFLTSKGSAYGLAFSGVGNGTFDNYSGGSASVVETITITATSSSSFTVVGSVSGSLGTATVGTPFTSTKINFTINAGGVAFTSGDVFTITTAPKWTNLRTYVSGTDHVYHWKAPGNDGTKEIYIGATAYQDVGADAYNILLAGFTGFNPSGGFADQPGYMFGPQLQLWNNSISYWFIANGQRVIIITKISTVYTAAYLGFILPFGTPTEYPYPLLIGGSGIFGQGGQRWSATDDYTSAFCILHQNYSNIAYSQARLRNNAGVWVGFSNYQGNIMQNSPFIWPGRESNMPHLSIMDYGLDGNLPLFPVLFLDKIPTCYGKLEGVARCAGPGLSAESINMLGIRKWIVFNNVFRTDILNFYAVELD